MAWRLTQTCIWAWILTLTECSFPESQVTCTFSQNCVLPCTFEPANNANITWYRQQVPILSYSLGTGPEKLLSPQLAGRASLFSKQVASGNASLQLERTNTQDRGRYLCQVTINTTTQDFIIIMRVEAPIKVLNLKTMQLGGNEVATCSSQDIYPAPHLSWSTAPPLQLGMLRPSTRKSSNELGLYSVESKLNLLRNSPGYTYNCTISTSYGSQTWTALLREVTVTKQGQLTIPCIAPRNMHNFILTWNFTNEGKSSVILTFNSQTQQISNHWEGRAHVDPDRAVTGDGSLHLQNLDSSPHVGMYTCTFSNLRTQYLVHNRVNITSVSGEKMVKGKGSKVWLTSIVVAAVSLCIVTVWCLKKKGGYEGAKDTEEATEMQPIKTGHTENGTPPEHRRLTADQTSND